MSERTESMTPLDALRHILAGYAPGDDDFLRRLLPKMGEIGKASLRILGEFLKKPGTSGLRRAVLPAVAKHDWPEWTYLLFDILSKEPELTVFDEGCAALGQLGTKSSWKTLQRLKTVRTARDHQIILDRELNDLESKKQPIAYYMGRIMEGESNPKLSAAGARMLAVLMGPQDVSALIQAYHDGDLVVKQHILRIMPCFQCPEANSFLAYTLKNTANDSLESRKLLDIVQRLGNMPKPSAKQECQKLVVDIFREQAKSLVGELNIALGQDGTDASHIFDALEELAVTTASTILLEALRLLVEGKMARFSVVIAERATEIEKQLSDQEAVLDYIAAALARLVGDGGAEPADVLPYFRDVFHLKLGGPLFLESYATLVSHQDVEILDELLADPEYERRFVIVDTIGAKEDDHYVDFFLKAIRDSIIDVGQRAVQHLGKLHRGREIFFEYFNSGETEKMRQAMWGFTEIQMQESADLLIDFIHKDLTGEAPVKGGLLVEAANALASLRVERAAPLMLEMLHDGQSLQLQVALAEALAALQTPESALGLLVKSANLRHLEVLFVVLEGSLVPFNSFTNAFPMEHYEEFAKLLERCCGDGSGHGNTFRALCSVEKLYILDLSKYERLVDRISEYLSVMRTKEAWDKNANDRLTAISKDIAKRCESLKVLAQKELDLTNIIQRTAPKGPLRSEAIVSLRTKLEDPDLILKAEMARSIASYVHSQLKVTEQDWKDIAQLCEIAGRCGQKDLIEPIKLVYGRATGLGLKSAAKNALLRLGLTDAEINRRAPITSILVIEPSAFFRKRLVEALKGAGEWEVREASSKEEADGMLKDSKCDLMIAECVEEGGKLLGWLQSAWDQNKVKYVYLCTSNRDLSGIGEPPWLIGTLYKPFPMEKLLEELTN